MASKPSEDRNNSREPVLPLAILAPENLRMLSTSKISREGIGVCPLLYRIDFFVDSCGTWKSKTGGVLANDKSVSVRRRKELLIIIDYSNCATCATKSGEHSCSLASHLGIVEGLTERARSSVG